MSRPSPPVGMRSGQAGVTLIEMMIVLVVVGIATGAATLGLGALGRNDAAEQEARRLAAAIGSAVDDTLISGVSQTMVWDAQGYQIGTTDRHALGGGATLARVEGAVEDVTLSAIAASLAADFVVQDSAAIWRVSFDGLSATVLPGTAP